MESTPALNAKLALEMPRDNVRRVFCVLPVCAAVVPTRERVNDSLLRFCVESRGYQMPRCDYYIESRALAVYDAIDRRFERDAGLECLLTHSITPVWATRTILTIAPPSSWYASSIWLRV